MWYLLIFVLFLKTTDQKVCFYVAGKTCSMVETNIISNITSNASTLFITAMSEYLWLSTATSKPRMLLYKLVSSMLFTAALEVLAIWFN